MTAAMMILVLIAAMALAAVLFAGNSAVRRKERRDRLEDERELDTSFAPEADEDPQRQD